MVLERSRRSRFDVLFVGRLGEGSMASTSASLGGKAAAGQGLFTRQSSGLVRELGVPAATGIALASVAVVNTFINFNAGLVSFNQADMTLPLLLGAAIWLVAMFAYKYLLEAIPRAGGEYVYLSRIISPALGAMAGISICIAFTYILAAAQKNQIPLGISIGASLTAVPFMVLNYNGVLYAYYVGGELKRPGRTYLYASVISIGLLVVVWLGVWLLMRNTVGLDF